MLAEPNSFFETEAIAKLGRKLRAQIEFVPTTQFLLPRDDFRAWASAQKRLVMENHYRRMRKRFGWLMQTDGEPEGGTWNFDIENRATYNAWKRAAPPRAITPLRENADAITREVIAMVSGNSQRTLASPPRFGCRSTKAAQKWLHMFIAERMPRFGIFEDMMAEGEPHLFHSVLSHR